MSILLWSSSGVRYHERLSAVKLWGHGSWFWKWWSGTCVSHRSWELSRGQDLKGPSPRTGQHLLFLNTEQDTVSQTHSVLQLMEAEIKKSLLVAAKFTSVSQKTLCNTSVTSLIIALDKFCMRDKYCLEITQCQTSCSPFGVLADKSMSIQPHWSVSCKTARVTFLLLTVSICSTESDYEPTQLNQHWPNSVTDFWSLWCTNFIIKFIVVCIFQMYHPILDFKHLTDKTNILWRHWFLGSDTDAVKPS